MKQYIPIMKLVVILFVAVNASIGFSSDIEEWTEAFTDLSTKDAVGYALKNAEDWPISAPDKFTVGERPEGDIEFVRQVLKSIGTVIDDIEENSSLELRDLFEALLKFSSLVSGKEGYLNELIATTCDHVSANVAWRLIANEPSVASEISHTLKLYRGLPAAKQWFMEYVEFDQSIREFQVNIKEAADDIPGDQLANWIMLNRGQREGKIVNVYSLMQEPDLLTLWRQMLGNDFQLSATIPAAIEFLKRGGKLVPAPDDIPGAIEDVFGESGIPFRHDSRSGALYPRDIWMSLNFSIDDEKLRMQKRNWFGD